MDDNHLRAIYYYEFRKGSSTREAATNINAAMGEGTTSQSTMSRWYRRFVSGDISFEVAEGAGRPSVLSYDDLRLAIEANPEASTRELATTLSVNQSTVDRHLNQLGYRYIYSQWVPHRLTPSQAAARVHICESLLLRPHRNDFLSSLVAADETWAYYEDATHHAVWVPPGQPAPTQPRPDTHRKKFMLCCWWDAEGMLYYELLADGETITAELYSRQLRNLAVAMQEKRRRRTEVHLLHDNARPHIAKMTRAQLQQLGWQTVPHPPYSPDISPCDYHLFRPLKTFLSQQHTNTYDSLKTAISNFFDSQTPDFWHKGIHVLPKRWQHIIDNDGTYITD